MPADDRRLSDRDADDEARPAGGWGALVRDHVEAHGGWTALADELARRIAQVPDAPTDRQTIEKGLRRLAERGSKAGGQYGRWVLRHLGVPIGLRRWVRGLGQYHRRFADLPTRLRLEQLRLWERPPISESPELAWIHLGIASVWLRMEARERCEARLVDALRAAPRAGGAARIEGALLRARLCCDHGPRAEVDAELARVAAWIDAPDLEDHDRACYRARLEAQRAWLLRHPEPGVAPDFEGALACLRRIPDGSGVPFVDFRRAEGAAACLWALGRVDEARALASEAAEHAADGGFVRFRIMALKQLAGMSTPIERERLRARAHRLAELLEDEDLQRRTAG